MLAHRNNGHTAQLAYWQQLRESSLSMECVSFITIHLWLSSLTVALNRSTYYLDPNLVAKMLELQRSNPSSLSGGIPELFGRQSIWELMSRSVNVFALFKLDGLWEPNPGTLSWVLVDIQVDQGRASTVEVILAPCTLFDKAQFAELVAELIDALNSVLPKQLLVSRTSKVQQHTHSLILPPPFTEESIILALLALLQGKMLDQQVATVNVDAIRQGLCYYYNLALRSPVVDIAFPWLGLTDNGGELLMEHNKEEVSHRRFHLASNQEPFPVEMFPRRRSYTSTVATPGPSEPFFLELANVSSQHQPGILLNTSGRSITALEKATLLGEYPSFDTNADPHLFQPSSLSIGQFTDLIYSLGGPEETKAHEVLLTGTHQSKTMGLSWVKDAIFPMAEWLHTGFDLDSLTLTCHEVPEILEAGNYHPYPNRDMSLTHRNELVVNIEGKAIPMHTCE
jgi:hypothetical protein